MTTSDSVRDAPGTPDASDVVTGPIGGARLRDPMAEGPEGRELGRLPAIDVAADDLNPVSSSPGSSSPAGTADKSSGPLAGPSDVGQAPQAVEAGLPARS